MANAFLEFRLIIVILVVLTLPGYALLALSPLWQYWQGFQKLIVAIALGIALYPIGFYAFSRLPAFFTLGPYKTGFLLILCVVVVVWRSIGEPGPKLQAFEWLGLAVVVSTLFTRWYVAHAYPYPAWTDSLHHTLLTELIATHGRLPATLDPYFPVPLGMYHLGLHAIAAVVMWLAQVPAHTALLWTAQTLNGLCGIGVYFVLDRTVGRAGAVVGAVTVGLLSYQPAFYVNWGRYTQVASQTILLVGWCVTHETIISWPTLWQNYKLRSQLGWLTIFAGLLSAAIFLLHFRVAVMYILLISIGLLTSFRSLQRNKVRLGVTVIGIICIGAIALLFVSTALWEALRIYIQINRAHIPTELVTAAQISEIQSTYYQFHWRDLDLASHTWLLVITFVAALIGLLRRNQVTILSLLWTAVLYLLGNAYVLGIPILNITNLGAILIMLYLPCALICGAAVEELTLLFKDPWRNRLTQLIVSGVLLGGLLAIPARVNDIEAFRYFVTPNDVDAMHWIQANTPEDALFAVNTHFWTPALPHGTDAGYWIPYFTGRKITAGVMLLNLAAYDYQIKILNLSRSVKRLATDISGVDELQAQGVRYIYIGAQGNFDGAGIKAEQVAKSDKVDLVYQNGNVFIFQITPK